MPGSPVRHASRSDANAPPQPNGGKAQEVQSWRHAEFRFYAELNDFLPAPLRQRTFPVRFRGRPAIKDTIEAQGVPHPEVDLILVNGASVGFEYRLEPGDRVAVYPMFERLDITPVLRLRGRPLRRSRFIVDVNLGKLARRLRLLGFDTRFDPALSDAEIAARSAAERRIVLTRDRRLLFFRQIERGLWVRATAVDQQLREVLERLDLHRQIRPLRRCIGCNGLLETVDKAAVLEQLEPKTRLYYEQFRRCRDCGKVYWAGSHVAAMHRHYPQFFGDD